MKIKINEFDGCFSFDFTPETMEDIAMLVRAKKNGLREVRGMFVYCNRDLSVNGSLVIGKRKEEKTAI